MNTQFQSSLSNLESKFNALLTSLTTSPTAATGPAAATALLDADDVLASSVETLRRHQENYSRIIQLRAEAEKLETRVKGIVRDVDAYQKEIRTVCDDESDLDTDSDSDSDERPTRRTKEVDYKLLLDFARRISKYNHQAAADAAAGTPASKKLQEKRRQVSDQDVSMGGMNGMEGTEPVSTVTKDATLWLDESANMTREVYMLPYPMEERIRMGLMGQIQLAAAEGRFDPDQEVERLVREAEGVGAAEPVVPPQAGDQASHAEEASKAAVSAGASTTGTVKEAPPGPAPAAAPAPKPKPALDLDLFDPEDEDV